MAGMVAENICRGLLTPVSWEQSFNEDVFRIDTRDSNLCQADPIPGLVNIPLSTIRQNLNKIPKDKVIDVSCRVGCGSGYRCRLVELPTIRAEF